MENKLIDSQNPAADDLAEHQLRWVAQWHSAEPSSTPEGLLGLVQEQHLQNFRLWHKEDVARDPRATDSQVAQVKRAIDKLNQKRNDLIEKIDEFLLDWLKKKAPRTPDDCPLHSETPGSMIDRLSILALRIYHMQEESKRETADPSHRENALKKIAILLEQKRDLIECLQSLLLDCLAAKRRFKLYRHLKMYNDPKLNPRIYEANED